MASRPSSADIDNLASISGLSPHAASQWLKHHNNDVNVAANAYFENPNALAVGNSNEWDEQQFHTDRSNYNHQGQQQSFSVQGEDSLKPNIFGGGPSRPPSRISNRGTTISAWSNDSVAAQGKNDAEREEEEIQKAVELSMSQHTNTQEIGTASLSKPSFGPANREYYDSKSWGMTFAGPSAREVLLNPDPIHCKRAGNPAFMKPCPSEHYLPALITILHNIPMAREALLAREHTTPEYGYDSDWWEGTAVRKSRIINPNEGKIEDEQAELIFETQRVMAFLDDTQRAFGSVEGVSRLDGIRLSGGHSNSASFLSHWRDAALKVMPENPLSNIFRSVGRHMSTESSEENLTHPFYQLELRVDDDLADKGHTIYELFDDTLYGTPDDADDTIFDKTGEIMTLLITRAGEASTGVGVDIPSVWYSDRYLQSSMVATKEMRLKKMRIKREIEEMDQAKYRLTEHKISGKTISANKLLAMARAFFERTALNSDDSNRVNVASGNLMDLDMSMYEELARQLQICADRVTGKLKDLEFSRNLACETLKKVSKLYTEPTENPDEPPYHKYTLRGVSADPRTMYVVAESRFSDEQIPLKARHQDKTWYKITWTSNDANPVSCEQVHESDVLTAAREESRNVLLVYASEKAIHYKAEELPTQLKDFVSTDNLTFATELEKAARQGAQAKRKAIEDSDDDNHEWTSLEPITGNQSSWNPLLRNDDPASLNYEESASAPLSTKAATSQSAHDTNRPTIDPSTLAMDNGSQGGQVTQERNGEAGHFVTRIGKMNPDSSIIGVNGEEAVADTEDPIKDMR